MTKQKQKLVDLQLVNTRVLTQRSLDQWLYFSQSKQSHRFRILCEKKLRSNERW